MFFRVLRILSIVFRIPLALVGAFALLYVLSYGWIAPDSAREYEEGMTPYHLRGYLWVLPWLFTEFVCLIGPRRNLVWFSAMLSVFIGAVIAWPVLTARHPELVHPMLGWEETGMLADGLLYFSLILFASVIVRLVFLSFLFSPPDDDIKSGEIDAAVLNPATARTVQEIAANPVRPAPKFRFGDADETILARFRALMRHLFFRRLGAHVSLLLGLLLLGCWFFLYPQPTKEEALQRDLEQMKAFRFSDGTYTAPRTAVCAAYRVMEYIDKHNTFEGMTKAEAAAWLGIDNNNPYHAVIRDSRELSVPSEDSYFSGCRERFLTISTAPATTEKGLTEKLPRLYPTALLYIRTDESGERIVLVEVVDSGFNDISDDQRHRISPDRSALYR